MVSFLITESQMTPAAFQQTARELGELTTSGFQIETTGGLHALKLKYLNDEIQEEKNKAVHLAHSR